VLAGSAGTSVTVDLSESEGLVELLLFSEVLVNGSVLLLVLFCSGFMDFTTAAGGLPEGLVLALLPFPCRAKYVTPAPMSKMTTGV
jgi:hypothetical protein